MDRLDLATGEIVMEKLRDHPYYVPPHFRDGHRRIMGVEPLRFHLGPIQRITNVETERGRFRYRNRSLDRGNLYHHVSRFGHSILLQ